MVMSRYIHFSIGAGAKNIVLTARKRIVFIYAQHLSRDTGYHES